MFVQQHCFQQSLHQMMTRGSGSVSHDSTRLCQIVVTLWDFYIHADAVRALSWVFSMHFFLSDGGSPRLVKNAEV